MKIYLFTYTKDNSTTIFQIYSTGRILAKQCLQLITGYNIDEFSYIGEDETTAPQNWIY